MADVWAEWLHNGIHRAAVSVLPSRRTEVVADDDDDNHDNNDGHFPYSWPVQGPQGGRTVCSAHLYPLDDQAPVCASLWCTHVLTAHGRWGIISDLVPLFGTYRIAYITISLASISVMLVVTPWVHSTSVYLMFNVATAFFLAFAFVCAEALTAERSLGMTVSESNKLQSWVWGSNMVGWMVGGFIGGQLQTVTSFAAIFIIG